MFSTHRSHILSFPRLSIISVLNCSGRCLKFIREKVQADKETEATFKKLIAEHFSRHKLKQKDLFLDPFKVRENTLASSRFQ